MNQTSASVTVDANKSHNIVIKSTSTVAKNARKTGQSADFRMNQSYNGGGNQSDMLSVRDSMHGMPAGNNPVKAMPFDGTQESPF